MRLILFVIWTATAVWGQFVSGGGAVGSGVSTWGGLTCGPPGYLCSRLDLNIANNPAVPPSVGANNCTAGSLNTCGNLLGRNTVVADPDFGSRIVRITDANLDPAQPNSTVGASCGGSQGAMTLNVDSTMLVVCNTSGRSYPMTFNSTSMQAALLYVGASGFPNGYFVGNNLIWSRKNPFLGYVLAGTAIQGFCFADLVAGLCPIAGPLDTVTPPSVGNGRIFTVYDFTSSNKCLGTTIFPGGFSPDWTNFGQPSANDTSFNAAYSYDISGTANVTNGSTDVTWAGGAQFAKRYKAGNTLLLGGVTYHITSINSVTDITITAAYAGATGTAAYTLKGFQGTGVNAVVYVPGPGCTMLNTETGAMTSDFSTDGTIGITDRWTLHDSFASAGSTYSFLGSTSCLSASCPTGSILPYIWQIGTTTVRGCSGIGCAGHYTEAAGYNKFINNGTNPWQDTFNLRSFSSPATPGCFFSCGGSATPAGLAPPWDNHPSWNNVDPADSMPFVTSSFSPTTPFPAALYNEIFAVNPGSGAISRFAHNFITERSQTFITQQGIGQVSQDGRFFLFSSDWLGTLGSTSGAATCTVGTNCRGDAFVVELK